MPSRRDFDLGVFRDAGLGLLQLADHPRVEQPGNVKERVVKRAETDDGGDVVRFGEHRDLRFVFVDVGEEILRRRRELLPDAGLCRLQDIAILVDQHGARQIACGGVGRQQFAKRPAVLIEQRPGVRDVVGHRQNVAADQLRMLVGIGTGYDQGILDDLARRPREQPVEAAVDGDVGDNGHQHRRQYGDDRKQADDLNVKPCRGPAAAPGLNHLPDLAGDDSDQQQDGRRVDQQE